MSVRGIGAWSAATAVLLALVGCGSSGSQSSTSSSAAAAPSTTAASSTPSTAQTTAAPTSSAASTTPTSSAGVTPPGTKLAVGKTAILALKPLGDVSSSPATERVQITVESIVKGTLADFNGIQLNAAQKAGIPFYVKVRLTNVGPGDLSASNNDPSIDIEGVDNTGQTQQSLTFIGNFPRCNSISPPKPMTRGKSFETCLTFLIPGGITAAAYTGTSDYSNSPVTWK
jgi:glucose/arabinose dehydrogenase